MMVIGLRGNIMDLVHLFQVLVTATQEHGFTTRNKATAMKNGQMDQPSKGSTQTERSTDTENSSGPIPTNLQGNLSTTK